MDCELSRQNISRAVTKGQWKLSKHILICMTFRHLFWSRELTTMMELKTATAEVMQESPSLTSPDIIMNPAAPSRTVHHYQTKSRFAQRSKNYFCWRRRTTESKHNASWFCYRYIAVSLSSVLPWCSPSTSCSIMTWVVQTEPCPSSVFKNRSKFSMSEWDTDGAVEFTTISVGILLIISALLWQWSF